MIHTAGSKSRNANVLSCAGTEFCRVDAPLVPKAVWQIESLLLNIFEYGDYSFRSALSGEYSDTLNCTFFLTKHNGYLIGAAGCLYAKKNSAIALVGPVGVAEEHHSKGIGTKLVTLVIEYLKQNHCIAVYLGVSKTNPAVRLYSALGFKKYKGIVMRLILNTEQEFEENYFSLIKNTKVRRIVWGDYPGAQALITYPGSMYTVDLRRSIFSSRYVEPSRFLPVFPEMMGKFAKYGGFANVLVSGHKENIVGFAQIRMLPGKAQRHIAEFDFYVHDSFIEQASQLLEITIQEAMELPTYKVNCYCLNCDKIKKNMIEALGGVHIATLPGNVCLNGIFEDVLIYEIRNIIQCH